VSILHYQSRWADWCLLKIFPHAERGMVRRPNIYEVVFAASVDTRAVLPQLIGSDVVKSGWESRDVMTD